MSVGAAVRRVRAYGGHFLLLAVLTLVTALLIINLALGILTRAAPQLNIFAVGFPITLMVGMSALMLSLPHFTPVIERLITEGLQTMLEVAQNAR